MPDPIPYVVKTDLLTLLTSLTYNGLDTNNFSIMELPKVGEKIDKLPCCRICPYQEDKSDPLSFELQRNRIYTIQIVFIDFNGGDFETLQSQREMWKQQAMQVIERDDSTYPPQWRTTLPNCPSVWGIDITGAPTFDRAKLSEYYSYQGVVVKIQSHE